jgi:AraC family transcriptional regulator
MSAPDILANMSRGWNRDPAGVALGTERTGVSAALWTHDQDDVQEVWADPDDVHNIVAIQLSSPFAEVRFDGRVAFADQVPRGGLQIVAAGVRPFMVTRGRWQVLHLYLPQKLISDLAEAEGPAGRPELTDPRCTADPIVQRIGREVLAEMRVDQPLSRLRIDTLGQDLAIQLLRRHSNLAGTRALSRQSARGGLAPWQVRRTTEFLAGNLAEEVGLEALAALAQLSPFHFARAFKRSTGLPPHRYQLRLRLERAQALLTGSDLPVTEIAARVGYDAPQTLARLFQRELGVSPTEYRRQHRL